RVQRRFGAVSLDHRRVLIPWAPGRSCPLIFFPQFSGGTHPPLPLAPDPPKRQGELTFRGGPVQPRLRCPPGLFFFPVEAEIMVPVQQGDFGDDLVGATLWTSFFHGQLPTVRRKGPGNS